MANYICVYKGKMLKFNRLYRCLKGKKEVSIVIPTYKEEENIVKLINNLKRTMKKYNYEIIVVDDSSPDRTPEIIDKMARADSRIIALHRNTRGIFSAIKDGIAISRGDIIVFMDADLSHPADVVPRLIEYIDKYDIVSASRFIKGGKLISPKMHWLLSRVLNKVCEIFLQLPVKDLTGGFHAIKKTKFNEIKFKYNSKWGEFDLELFYRAKRKGMKIKEIPFVYKFRDFGTPKSNDLIYGWKYLSMALKLKFFD